MACDGVEVMRPDPVRVTERKRDDMADRLLSVGSPSDRSLPNSEKDDSCEYSCVRIPRIQLPTQPCQLVVSLEFKI